MTGTEGTGGRTIGELLAIEHGFRHLRFAGGVAVPASEPQLVSALGGPAAGRGGGVVTWTGACPPPPALEALRSLGFDWVWLDGDRGATLPAASEGARFVDPFDANGSFRPVSAVVAEVLTLS